MCKASVGHFLARTKRAGRRLGVWPLAALALAGPYLFWFLLRPRLQTTQRAPRRHGIVAVPLRRAEMRREAAQSSDGYKARR